MGNRLRQLLTLYRNLPIRRKLLLILYVQIAIPLALTGFVSYRTAAGAMQQKSADYTADVLHTLRLRFSDYTHNLALVSQDLLYDRRIYTILNSEIGRSDRLSDYENEETMNNILKRFIQSRDEIQGIAFMSFSGKTYALDNGRNKAGIKESAPFASMINQARSGRGNVVWYVDVRNGQVENVYLTRTIYNQDTYSQEIGVMVIQVSKTFLTNIFRELETRSVENVALVSGENQWIVSRKAPSAYALSLEPSSLPGSWLDKEHGFMVSQVTMEDTGWHIMMLISLKELNREIDTLRNWIVLFSLIGMAIMSGLSLMIAVDFITPINRLVRGMEKLRKGESQVRVEVDRGDELGFLKENFNQMAEEIHHLVHGIYREQLTRKEAEIKALQAQINPHFLFNTLETINWTAQLKGVPEISDTVTALSTLMEAGIGRDDRLVTLEEEFHYADQYMIIQRSRFEERLELVREIDPETLGILIPRLVIQPLIENAVCHGVEKSRGRGVIRLECRFEGEEVHVVVTDNGIGIEPDALEQLNKSLAESNDDYFRRLQEGGRQRVGLENVNRRIRLFYGDQYGLSVQSVPEQFTRVTIRIPRTRPEGKESYYVQSPDRG